LEEDWFQDYATTSTAIIDGRLHNSIHNSVHRLYNRVMEWGRNRMKKLWESVGENYQTDRIDLTEKYKEDGKQKTRELAFEYIFYDNYLIRKGGTVNGHRLCLKGLDYKLKENPITFCEIIDFRYKEGNTEWYLYSTKIPDEPNVGIDKVVGLVKARYNKNTWKNIKSWLRTQDLPKEMIHIICDLF